MIRHFLGHRVRCCRGDSGETLILVLIFLVLFSLVMVALLSGVGTNFSMTAVTKDQSQLMYAADAGLEWGANVERQTNPACGTTGNVTPVTGSDPITGNAPFTVPNGTANATVKVTCFPISGLGSNSLGGYAVIAGVNYPASASGSQAFSGNTTKCESMSADPVGSGSPTYAKLVTGTANSPPLCLTYPAGTASTPLWTDSGFDPVDVRTGSADGTTTSALTAVTSASLFTSASTFVGWTITDTANALQPGTTVTSEGVGTATLSLPAVATVVGSDTFTVTADTSSQADATVTNGKATVTSSSLFTGTANYVGWPVTDSAGGIPGNATVKTENNATHQITLTVNATASATSDTVTVGGVTGYSPLQSVYALDKENVWSVGGPLAAPDAGSEGIFWFDGEDTWNYIGASTGGVSSTTLNGVWAADSHDVWAVGNSGTILYCGVGGQDCTGGSGMPSWSQQTVAPSSQPDGVLTKGSHAAVSSSLFTDPANYVGWTITDSAGQIPANTTISNENNTTHTATMNHNAANAATGDVFTVSPPGNLTSITGTDSSHLWAVGQGGVILTCTSQCKTTSATWTAVGSPTTTDLQAVATDGHGNVWAVGGNKIVMCSASCSTAGSSWTAVTSALPGGIAALQGVSALNATNVWAVDNSGKLITCTSACTTSGATWVGATLPGGVKSLQAVTAADATDVWAVGSNASGGQVIYCTTGCNTADATWVSQGIDQTESTLYSVTAEPAATHTDPTWGGDVWAVGVNPTATNQTGWITYSPLASHAASLADITGGPVLNGQNTNFPTGMTLHQGNFDQYFKSPSTCPSQPTNLNILTTAGNFKYNCTSSIPTSVQTLDEPLPSESAASGSIPAGIARCVASASCVDMGAHPFTQTVTGVPGCTSYTVYAPGYYKTAPKFSSGATTYFESGVYYFATGGWGAVGADNQPPVYMIGGQPSPGDLESEANSVPPVTPPATTSPCWSAVKAKGDSYKPSGTWYDGGTGVEWILGGGTWLDLHTVTVELFTREMPTTLAAIQGECGPSATTPCSQGITLHEVPPLCPTGTTSTSPDGAVHPGPYCVTSASKWAPTRTGSNQPLQIDANKHNPYVYMHGDVYMPDNDMTLFTNQHGVWTGPIDVNSLELTYNSATSPPLQIIAGGLTVVQFELVATASDSTGSTLTEEAVATVDYTKTPTKLTVQSWRVCNGTTAGNACTN